MTYVGVFAGCALIGGAVFSLKNGAKKTRDEGSYEQLI